MKKALSVILAIAVIFSLGTTTFAAEANFENEFNPDDFFSKARLVSYDGTTVEFKAVEVSNTQETTSTLVTIVATTPEETTSLRKTLAKRGSNYREIWDGNKYAKLYMTVVFEDGSASKGTTRRITRCYGGVQGGESGTSLGSNVYMTKQRLTYGADGPGPTGSVVSSTDKYPSPGARTFSYSTVTPWVYTSSYKNLGANFTVYFKRGTGTWPITLDNNI